MNTVTVIICTHNNAKLLARALDTLARQDAPHEDWSALVVDNNSTDETRDVVERFIVDGCIANLRYVHEPTQGLAHARRRAVIEIDSPWMAFVDDDCFLAADWVRQVRSFADAHPQAGAFGGRNRIAWEAEPDELIARYASSFAAQDGGDQPSRVCKSGPVTHLVGAGLVLNRQALMATGWMDVMTMIGRSGARLTAGEDTEIIRRIERAGYELWYNPAMELQHFITRSRMSVDYLCRLHRGFGQARPSTAALIDAAPPSFAGRICIFSRYAMSFSRLLRSVVFDHLLPRRPLNDDQRIGLHRRLGEVEGAWRFLLWGHRA